MQEITGTGKPLEFHKLDLLDKTSLMSVFANSSIDAAIHFAGFKAVGESVEAPLRYYQNNLIATMNLCEAMAAHNVKHLVFSSSATVYGDPPSVPIREDIPLNPAYQKGKKCLRKHPRCYVGW